MKKTLLITGLAFVLPFLVQAAPDDPVAPGVIKAFRDAGLPVEENGIRPIDFELPLLEGGRLKLSDLKGRPVFLNFWATWCGPCRSEMPSMEAVYKRLKDRGFGILAVNIGEDSEDVLPFMKRYKLSFPVALDTSSDVAVRYGIQAIPTTYIIDKRGLIVSRVVGSIDWNKPRIITAFESLF
ncbi:MAG: TlpA family protein disulfide reductase [Treponema sp.]|jgi:thiol-disulfide isomerase/thioredoxin|nr:TlpA family protein disulfide reductase [Treponema sp.]